MLPAFGLALALACGSERPPHLFLIVIDSLRADHLGAYGYTRPTSPRIDRLARHGVVFTRATAQSSWTKPSVASLFTSRLPSEHGAVSFARHLDPRLPTLAERLQSAGYRTLGVSGNFVHVNEQSGLARGFDDWRTRSRRLTGARGDVLIQIPEAPGGAARLAAPSARELNRVLLELLPEDPPAPLFVYVHYMEPHAGYLPPEPWRTELASGAMESGPPPSSDYVVDLAAGRRESSEGERRRLIALYDAEIAAVDAALGDLVDALETRGLLRHAVLAVLSDHGEEFLEHGNWFHAITLHAESLHVPLVLFDGRSGIPPGRRDEPVDLLDVAPTLLACAGLAAAPGMRGRDLLAPPLAPRDGVAELHPDPLFEAHLRPRKQLEARLRWPFKVILDRGDRALVYRLDADPGEQEPLEPAAAPDLVAAGRDALRARSSSETGAPGDALDAQEREGLRALGYAE